MSNKQRRPAKSLRATRQKRQLRNRGSSRLIATPMYKSVRPVMPEEFDTTLKYIVLDLVTNVGGTAASIRFRTEAYDVDPALASTAMPGFTEFAAFYQRYRTLSMGYKFSAANQEAFPNAIIHGYSVSSIASGSLGITYAGNPLFSTGILGPNTGMSKGTFRKNATIVKIAGTSQPLYDDLYTGSTTSATLATFGTVYCHFGILSPQPLTALGVLVQAEISLRIRFYRPNLLLS
jgi:hypothetical protein